VEYASWLTEKLTDESSPVGETSSISDLRQTVLLSPPEYSLSPDSAPVATELQGPCARAPLTPLADADVGRSSSEATDSLFTSDTRNHYFFSSSSYYTSKSPSHHSTGSGSGAEPLRIRSDNGPPWYQYALPFSYSAGVASSSELRLLERQSGQVVPPLPQHLHGRVAIPRITSSLTCEVCARPWAQQKQLE
jgi:hypothetical protein